MDIGELIFGWVHKGAEARKALYFEASAILRLEGGPYCDRLAVLSGALQLVPPKISFSDAIEAPDLATLYLPRTLSLATDNEGNFLIYFYRLLLYCGAVETQQTVEKDFAAIDDAILSSALSAPAIHRALLDRHNGFKDILQSVQGLAKEASALFSKKDSSFSVWADFLNRSLGVQDFIPTDEEVRSLKKQWSHKWVAHPASPLHFFSILPLCRRRISMGGEQEVASTDNADSKHLNKSVNPIKEIDVKTSARPEVKNLAERDENPLSHVFEKLLTAE